MDFLTPEVFDVLVFVVIGIGGVWAGMRLRQDLSRKQIDDAPEWWLRSQSPSQDDTQPNQPVSE